MNRRDLKRLNIDSSFIISPDRFLAMFGIECDKLKKITIHDLHYILGDNLKHAGVNKINHNSLYTGEIILIGTENNFKPYYRPIIYRIKVNDKIEEKVSEEVDIKTIAFDKLYELYHNANNLEDLNKYLDEIYNRICTTKEIEYEPTKTKIYAFSNKTNYHWY